MPTKQKVYNKPRKMIYARPRTIKIQPEGPPSAACGIPDAPKYALPALANQAWDDLMKSSLETEPVPSKTTAAHEDVSGRAPFPVHLLSRFLQLRQGLRKGKVTYRQDPAAIERLVLGCQRLLSEHFLSIQYASPGYWWERKEIEEGTDYFEGKGGAPGTAYRNFVDFMNLFPVIHREYRVDQLHAWAQRGLMCGNRYINVYKVRVPAVLMEIR